MTWIKLMNYYDNIDSHSTSTLLNGTVVHILRIFFWPEDFLFGDNPYNVAEQCDVMPAGIEEMMCWAVSYLQ